MTRTSNGEKKEIMGLKTICVLVNEASHAVQLSPRPRPPEISALTVSHHSKLEEEGIKYAWVRQSEDVSVCKEAL